MLVSFFKTISSPDWLWFWEMVEFFSIIVIVLGCFGEGWAEHHKFSDAFASPKPAEYISDKVKRASWLAVVIGLAIELVAFGFTFIASNREIEGLKSNNSALRSNVAALEMQVMQASNNIVNNDVRNWPISEVNATAWFTVMGTNMDVELTNLPDGRKAQMTLWKNEREGVMLDTLEAGSGDIRGRVLRMTIGTVDRRVYRVQLHSFNFLTAEGINAPPVKTIDDIHLVHVDLNFLPFDSQIANGRIILTVNNVTKFFDIPNQNDTNSNMGWFNDFRCWFVATNGVQSTEKQFLYLRN